MRDFDAINDASWDAARVILHEPSAVAEAIASFRGILLRTPEEQSGSPRGPAPM